MNRMFCYLVLSFFTVTASAAEKTITLDVPKMYCPICPITVQKSLENVNGVIKADANSETKTATVTYDTDKAKIDDFLQATKKAGYPSTLRIE